MWTYQRCLLSKNPTTSLLNIVGKASTSSSSSAQRRNPSKSLQKPQNIAPFVSRNRPSFRAPQSSSVEADGEDDAFLNSLTNRGDFYGVISSKSKTEVAEPVSIEIAVSNLQTQLDRNQRISGEHFVRTASEFDADKVIEEVEIDQKGYIKRLVTEKSLKRHDIVDLLLKSCSEADLGILDGLKDVVLPGYYYYGRDVQLLLFESLFKNPKLDFLNAVKFANEMVSLRLIRNRNVFLEVAAYHLNKTMSYQEAFDLWKSACSVDNTVAGGNVFLERVLSDKKLSKFEEKRRIKEIIRFYEKVKSPNDAIAQLIVSLISTGRFVDAKVLWLRFQIEPKHFLNPIRKLDNSHCVEVNIIHIREFAQLLEECVLVELKAKKKKSSLATPIDVDEEEELSPAKPPEPDYGNVEYLIEYWQPGRKKKYGKKPKLRKFYVSPDQLERLQQCIQKVEKKLENAMTPK